MKDLRVAKEPRIVNSEVLGQAIAAAIIAAVSPKAVDDTRISCGCCRGPVGDRCVCWIHQDIRNGLFPYPKVCSRHKDPLVRKAVS